MDVNDHTIRTVEALYQACRFPNHPKIQQAILDEHSPMGAKHRSRESLAASRADWHDVNIALMRWCLRLKLSQHWETFGALLLETGDRSIVECSYKDAFWGARPSGADPEGHPVLIGVNALGRLLMELRAQARLGQSAFMMVAPEAYVPALQLLGEPVRAWTRGPHREEPRPGAVPQ